MSATEHYGFYLEDNPKTKVRVWREKINGLQNSVFARIDEILFSKGAKSVAVRKTLLSNAWEGMQAPFTQTIEVEGLAALQNGAISVAQNATFEQREMAREAMLCVVGQANEQLTIAADGELPDIDIPVDIILLG